MRIREGTIYNSANPWAKLYKPDVVLPPPGFNRLFRELNPTAPNAIRAVGACTWECLGEDCAHANERRQRSHVLAEDVAAGLTKAGL